jgi:hypothetical protein
MSPGCGLLRALVAIGVDIEEAPVARLEPLAELVRVPGPLEQVCIAGRCERGVRVSELVGDSHRIEAHPDDQLGRERVPERVRRNPIAELGPVGRRLDSTAAARTRSASSPVVWARPVVSMRGRAGRGQALLAR